MRSTVAAWVLSAATIATAIAWVARSDRHRRAGFELDCTSPPAAPEGLRSSPGPEGVSFRWQLDPDVQIATSYVLEVGSAPGAKNVTVVSVPRGVDTVTAPLPQGASFARVFARNYCGTSLPSAEVRSVVP